MAEIDMFRDADDFDLTEEQLGYRAGYRGDELLEGHSQVYLDNYEIGRETRVTYDERRAARNGTVGLRRNRSQPPGD
jgi:hypothetical protein